MVSLGLVRSLSIMAIALLGILGQVAVDLSAYDTDPDPPGFGWPLAEPEGWAGSWPPDTDDKRAEARRLLGPPGLPDLPAESAISREWTAFYDAVRQLVVLAAILGVLVTALLQYREEVAEGSLVLSPIAVLAYLALPALLPDDLGMAAALLALVALTAIALGVWADLQPDDFGRPAWYSALGVTLAMVIYVGGLARAVAIPGQLVGAGPEMAQVRWALELLAVLVAPAALTVLPALKLAWHRRSRGPWWS